MILFVLGRCELATIVSLFVQPLFIRKFHLSRPVSVPKFHPFDPKKSVQSTGSIRFILVSSNTPRVSSIRSIQHSILFKAKIDPPGEPFKPNSRLHPADARRLGGAFGGAAAPGGSGGAAGAHGCGRRKPGPWGKGGRFAFSAVCGKDKQPPW